MLTNIHSTPIVSEATPIVGSWILDKRRLLRMQLT